MVGALIMFCVVVAVCAMAVTESDSSLLIPAIVVLAIEVVALIGLAVSWVKDRKKAKEKEDNG